MWARNSLVNSSGAIEHTQTFYFLAMYGMHRPSAAENISHWERQSVYSKQSNMMLTPSDVEGNQMVSMTYDHMAVPQDQWAYDTRTRRIRKIVYNPYVAPEGGVTLIEDRSGFLGYIHHYNWRYIGE